MNTSKRNKAWTDADGLVHEGVVHQSVDEFTVIDCEYCQFKHVIPLPTAAELEKTYSHEYYTKEKPFYIERYLEDKEWWDFVYKERYEMLEKHLGGRPGSILDVGSGPGLFLEQGRSRGWATKGIEPSEKAAEYCQSTLGLDVLKGYFDGEMASVLGKFDTVNLGEVLEHLPNPAVMLENVRTVLRENGLLLVIVPNDFNPFQRILNDSLGFEPWWVAPPHHLNYFDTNSIKLLVEKAGFETLKVGTTFPIDIFLLMGKNYIRNDEIGRYVHDCRKKFEIALYKNDCHNVKNILYDAFMRAGIGREVFIVAKKVG